MSRLRILAFLAPLVPVALFACGGSDATDAFVPAADGGAGDGATTSDGNGGGPGSDAAPAGDAGGGAFIDAPPTLTNDGGASNDGGPGGSTTQISCGATSCSLATGFCCVYQNANPPPDFFFACASGSGCPTVSGTQNDSTALLCSSSANCAAGAVCCVHQGGGKTWSECATSCAGGGGGGQSAQLCDPTAANTGCSASQPCSSKNISDWGLPRGYATCGGVGN